MARRRGRLLLDTDGFLTHGFVKETCRRLRERGFDATPEKVDQWDLMKALNIPEEVQREVYKSMEEPGVAMQFDPEPGSQDFVRECEEWIDVYMVTSPMGGRHWAHDRADWLHEHYRTPFRRVVPIHDKFIVYGDGLVDDKLAHLINWSGEFPHGLAVLWRIPPNRNDAWPVEASTFEELRVRLEVLKRRFT